METFEQKIINAINAKLNDGAIEKLVEDKVRAAFSDALKEVFSYGGNGKKMIESKLNEVIVPVIEKHDFNRYLVNLDSVLTEIVNNTNLADNKKILENFRGLMKEPEKKEITLSEIFEQYCKHIAANVNVSGLEANCEDGEPYYSHVTANMEVEQEDKGWFKSIFDDCYVKFTCDEDEDLNCQIKLYKRTSEDRWTILNGVDSVEINSLRNLSDFEVFLSILQRGYVKIIMDTQIEREDDIEPEEKPEWRLN